jgi:hypothetical protein
MAMLSGWTWRGLAPIASLALVPRIACMAPIAGMSSIAGLARITSLARIARLSRIAGLSGLPLRARCSWRAGLSLRGRGWLLWRCVLAAEAKK